MFAMASLPEEIMGYILNLPDRERIILAAKLLQSTGNLDESEEAVQSAWNEEIGRRLNDVRTERVIGIPADVVLKELEEAFR